MKKSHDTNLSRPIWSPTCFGNVVARDFAFRFVKEAAAIAPPLFQVNDLDSNCEIIAWAGLLAAIGGDQQLINECGFAIEFIRRVSSLEIFEVATLEQVLGYLRIVGRQSAIKDHWSRESRGNELEQLVMDLIAQLERFPVCKRTKFDELTRKEMKVALRKLYCDESGGDFLYDETMIVEDCNPLDILDIGRYRRIQELRILAKTSLPSPNSMDWNVKFALQNWIMGCDSLEFNPLGEITHITSLFQFPQNIGFELSASRLRSFTSSFLVTDTILTDVLQDCLTTIRIGQHELSPHIFDEIEKRCPKLERFEVLRFDKWGTDEFVKRAEQFQENRPNVAVVLNGRYLRPENKIEYIEEPKPHTPPGPYFPFEFFCYTEDRGEIASLHLSVLTNTGWAVEFELVDDYDLNGYGIAGLLRAIIHDQKLEKKIECIGSEGSDVKVTLNSAKAAKRLGKLASQALQDESILRKLIARTRELGLEDY